jgi:hypothetical protein
MNLSTEQAARFTSVINCFGDAFAQDRTDHRMHEWLAIIRNEMVDEWCVPLAHPWLIPQLDYRSAPGQDRSPTQINRCSYRNAPKRPASAYRISD